MARFNDRPPTQREQVLASLPDTRTDQGGEGFVREPKTELFLLGVSNTVSHDSFYKSGKSRDDRFQRLVHLVTTTDPDWVRAFGGWLRSKANMRTASTVLAAEYIAAGGPQGRELVRSVLLRPDEPGELLAYWTSKYGRAIPKPIKRGVGDALGRLYTERNALRYDGQSKGWRFGDVIAMTRPKPATDEQAAVWEALITRRHGGVMRQPEVTRMLAMDEMLYAMPAEQRFSRRDMATSIWPWERMLSWLGDIDTKAKAQVWAELIDNGQVGAMALVRNLRRLDEVNVDSATVLKVNSILHDREAIRSSRQFPLRFLQAYKAVDSDRWTSGLAAALEHSLDNVPALEGNTLIMLDISGSMAWAWGSGHTETVRGGRGVSTVKRVEVGAVFAGALHRAATREGHSAVIVPFNTQPYDPISPTPNASILRFADEVGSKVRGGTSIWNSTVAAVRAGVSFDQIIVLTDEEQGYGGWHEARHLDMPVFIYNLGGEEVGAAPELANFHVFGSLSDASFTQLKHWQAVGAKRHVEHWPWESDSTEAVLVGADEDN